jgi:hypothetical protein
MKTKTLSVNGFIDPSDSIVKCNCTGGAIITKLRSSKIYPREIIVKKVDSSANAVTLLPARREFLEDATLQVETATVVGTIVNAGNAAVVITSAEFTEITLAVPVASGDTASIIATKIKAALTAHAQIGDYNTGAYDVSGSDATVVLTQIDPTGNDSTLNISIDNGTCTGITTAATSADTTAGVAVTLATQNEYLILVPTDNGWVKTLSGGVNATETLANKTLTTPTLTSPVLTTPKINGQYVVSKSIGTAHADITLSTAERQADIIKITGTGDGGFNLIFNVDTIKTYLIDNQTGQACTCKNAAGTTIVVATTKRAILWNDGTDIVRISADA